MIEPGSNYRLAIAQRAAGDLTAAAESLRAALLATESPGRRASLGVELVGTLYEADLPTATLDAARAALAELEGRAGLDVVAAQLRLEVVVAHLILGRLADAGSCRVRTETRVALTDPESRRRFRRYWRRVVPGVRLLRHDWLRAVRRAAERRVSGHRPTVAH
jgi:hypothetical protein